MAPVPNESSLLSRYFAKLIANLFALLATGVSYLIVPRSLGPQAFGQYSFFSTLFQQLFTLLDFGALGAFFSKFSQRPKELGLATTYLIYLSAYSALAFIGLLMIHLFGSLEDVFSAETEGGVLAFLGLIWAILWSASIFSDKFVDALALTVPAEKIRMVLRSIFTTIILLMYFFDAISIWSFFFWNMGYLFVLTSLFIFLGYRSGHSIPWPKSEDLDQLRSYFSEYVTYCRPLALVAAFSAFSLASDRWVLNYYGGSVQQGFFSLAWLLCSLPLIFSTAFVPLFWREISKARGEGSKNLLGQFMGRQFRVLFAITTSAGAIAFIFADELSYIAGGREYAEAAVCLAIMSLYPTYQVYGQMSSAIFLSYEQTKIYALFAICYSLLGFFAAIYILDNKALFGFENEASALAFKLVVLQAVFVNLQLYFNCRLARISYWSFLANQIVLLLVIVFVAFLSKLCVESFVSDGISDLLFLAFAVPIYGSILLALTFAVPGLLGFERKEITNLIVLFFKKYARSRA